MERTFFTSSFLIIERHSNLLPWMIFQEGSKKFVSFSMPNKIRSFLVDNEDMRTVSLASQ